MDTPDSIERDDKMRELVEDVIRVTEEELLQRLAKLRDSAQRLDTVKEFEVEGAIEHWTKSIERQQTELELFVKRLRTLDELRKRSWLERFQAWTGPVGLALAVGKILYDFISK